MGLNRREIIGVVAAGATGAVVTRLAEAQAPSGAPQSPAADVQAAREGYRRDALRIASVNLPQTTEPAVHFRA